MYQLLDGTKNSFRIHNFKEKQWPSLFDHLSEILKGCKETIYFKNMNNCLQQVCNEQLKVIRFLSQFNTCIDKKGRKKTFFTFVGNAVLVSFLSRSPSLWRSSN